MDAPTEDDCCHSDCRNCVLDIYQRQLKSNAQNHCNSINQVCSQTRYKAFKLVRIEESTPSAKVYTFGPENPDGEERRFFFKPGEHAVLRNSPTSQKSEPLSRPYTPIPWDTENVTFSVVIKLYPHGKMSKFIESWSIGDTTFWRGPYGDFTYEPNTFRNVVMLCMGTGVAPMYAVSKHITENENDETFIKVLYGSSSPDEIILRREIAQLTSFWNFQCTHFISRGFQDYQQKFNETFVRGRIKTEHVETVLEQLDTTEVLVLVCGTDEFNRDMSEVVVAHGLSGKHVHVFS